MQNNIAQLDFEGGLRRTSINSGFQINHSHADLECNLVLGGEGKYVLNDGEHKLEKRTLVWLFPGEMHRLVRSSDLEMWVVTARPRLWDTTLLVDLAGYRAQVLAEADAVALDRLFDHISQDADEPQLFNAGVAYALQSARRASRNSAGPRRKPLPSLVSEALALLRSGKGLESLEDLARDCGATARLLGRLLLQHTGSGYVEWRNRARLERFHIVYRDSNGLLEAALAAGFGSYAQFHRVFVEFIGCTPGDWARAGANTDRIALSSAGSAMAKLDGDLRMSWYYLARLVLPTTRTWINDAFRTCLVAKRPVKSTKRTETGFQRSLADIAEVRRNLIGAVREVDPEGAQLIAAAYSGSDISAAFEEAAAPWTLSSSDVADTITAYLAIAWMAANDAGTPEFEQVQALRRRIGVALAATDGFAAADPIKRQTVAEAFIAQTMFLYKAWFGARSAGDGSISSTISEIAQSGAMRIFGIDLREERLDF